MAPQHEDDWSDSDDEEVGDTVTSVQLGVPDGVLDSETDLRDAAVSRIGGLPAFLTSPEPPLESSLCKNCSTPMELVIQVWCPLENSPNDRALYVWACSRGVCQGLAGSVRAWRGVRFNEKYAAKLEKQKAREAARKAKANVAAAGVQPAFKSNPFSLGANAPPNPFGLGSAIFGAESASEPDQPEETETNPSDEHDDEADASDSEGEEDSESEGDLVTAMATTTLETSPWTSAPSYPPLYLSTTSEYVPPAPKVNFATEEVHEDDDDDGKKGKDATWTMEGYENSLEIDHAFERFSKRVGYEAEQCIRYELGGTPLPFASDEVFDRLFPKPPAGNIPVTKPDFKVTPPAKRTYDTSSISPCPHCNSKRVFECQLMPNLINVLRENARDEGKKPQTDEERRKEVERVLKGDKSVERTGMGWGTCMIFSCEKDCCEDKGSPLKNCWREELVLVQWDK